jgi:hypothetical protein
MPGRKDSIQKAQSAKVYTINSIKLSSTSMFTTLLELAGVPKDQTPPTLSMDSPKLTTPSSHTRNSSLLLTILLGYSRAKERV